jgi:hypothetical protein
MTFLFVVGTVWMAARTEEKFADARGSERRHVPPLKSDPDCDSVTIGQLAAACHSPGMGAPGTSNFGGDDSWLARRAIMAEGNAASSPTQAFTQADWQVALRVIALTVAEARVAIVGMIWLLLLNGYSLRRGVCTVGRHGHADSGRPTPLFDCPCNTIGRYRIVRLRHRGLVDVPRFRNTVAIDLCPTVT